MTERGLSQMERPGGSSAPPHAAALVESLRAIGYHLPTAVADLIDNSITAAARNIRVEFNSDPGRAWVAVIDDGVGMSEDDLQEAMRLGTSGPHALRQPRDLGRFGLGLKTASFSQARRLTVVTRTAGGSASCRTWDLDLVAELDDWHLLDSLDAEAAAIMADLDIPTPGTAVLWRTPDRCGEGAHLREGMAAVRDHLAAVFGRYLQHSRLQISVGGQTINPWDPFLATNPATQDLGTEVLGAGELLTKITPYVLPHPSRLTAADSAKAGGPTGWHTGQGFYIYRGDRLLTLGGWLGLRGLARSPQARLARIAVDISTEADHAWQVDIRKSSVRPPDNLRSRLRELADHARARSEQVFRHRGSPLSTGGRDPRSPTFVWHQHSQRGRLGYRVNREHPVVASALNGQDGTAVESVLRLVEETIPIGLIAVEASDAPDRTPQVPLDGAKPTEIAALLATIIAGLPKDPAPRAALLTALSQVEPFNRYPELVQEHIEGARGVR
ncbi:ATP-binding protein [Longispora sp. K20-0274]|uniref:ATP-binding protein n=1 Tax=Longispora sp. K20-0274 TaxID=3088255 RepID=UPI00399A51D9